MHVIYDPKLDALVIVSDDPDRDESENALLLLFDYLKDKGMSDCCSLELKSIHVGFGVYKDRSRIVLNAEVKSKLTLLLTCLTSFSSSLTSSMKYVSKATRVSNSHWGKDSKIGFDNIPLEITNPMNLRDVLTAGILPLTQRDLTAIFVKCNSVISVKEFSTAVLGYKTSSAHFSNPGPELIALQRIMEKYKTYKDRDDVFILFDEIKEAIVGAQKDAGAKQHRVYLLMNDAAFPDDKTGVSGVIREISKKILTIDGLLSIQAAFNQVMGQYFERFSDYLICFPDKLDELIHLSLPQKRQEAKRTVAAESELRSDTKDATVVAPCLYKFDEIMEGLYKSKLRVSDSEQTKSENSSIRFSPLCMIALRYQSVNSEKLFFELVRKFEEIPVTPGREKQDATKFFTEHFRKILLLTDIMRDAAFKWLSDQLVETNASFERLLDDLPDYLPVEVIQYLQAYFQSNSEDITKNNKMKEWGCLLINMSERYLFVKDKQIELTPDSVALNFDRANFLSRNNQAVTVSDIKKYSLHLMWLNKSDYKEEETASIYLNKSAEDFYKHIILPALKWAKSNPDAKIYIWFDGELTSNSAIENSRKILTQQLSFHLLSSDQVVLRDIRDLTVVRCNADSFAAWIPVYFRIDLLKLIVLLDSIERDDAAVFSDLEFGDLRQNKDRMSKEELFDQATCSVFQKVGLICGDNIWKVYHACNKTQQYRIFENQFIQLYKKNMQSKL